MKLKKLYTSTLFAIGIFTLIMTSTKSSSHLLNSNNFFSNNEVNYNNTGGVK